MINTLSTVNTNVDSIKTTVGTINTNASNASTYSKNAQDRLGATNDTGGSSTAGTASAKLNKLITDLGTVSTNASNASSYSNTAKTQIGTSTDTASQTGTSLQSKLKYAANTIASLSSTISTINTNTSSLSNIGTSSDSNTSSTIYGKLNKILGNSFILDSANMHFWVSIPSITGTMVNKSGYNSETMNYGSTNTTVYVPQFILNLKWNQSYAYTPKVTGEKLEITPHISFNYSIGGGSSNGTVNTSQYPNNVILDYGTTSKTGIQLEVYFALSGFTSPQTVAIGNLKGVICIKSAMFRLGDQ